MYPIINDDLMIMEMRDILMVSVVMLRIFEVPFTSTSSNVLYSWSHDIRGAGSEFELNTRWIQWGAYSPIFRFVKDQISNKCFTSNKNFHLGPMVEPGESVLI